MDDIEKALLKDLPDAKKLNALLRLSDVKKFYWDTDDYIRSAILEERCVVIKDQSALKGIMIMECRDPQSGFAHSSLAIGSLAVHPKYRNEGLGIKLVEYAKQVAFRKKLRLYAESFFEYKKINFYQRLGFKRGASLLYNGKPYHLFFLDPRNIPPFPKSKTIQISDRLEYLFYLKEMPVIPSDVTFENLFVYDSPSRHISLSLLNGNVIITVKREDDVAFYPIVGVNQLDKTVLQCLCWLSCNSNNGRFIRFPLSTALSLQPATKAGLRIQKERDHFDYLYDPQSLAFFNHPKLRTQKQNLMRFLEKNPLESRITPSMRKEVKVFQDNWMDHHAGLQKRRGKPVSQGVIEEYQAMEKALAYQSALDLHVAGIYLSRKLQGFSVTTFFNQTAYVHFEKATRKKGAYQAVVQQEGKTALEHGTRAVNREQDLGMPGLRTSKMRYNPVGFLEKCKIVQLPAK